MKNSRQIVHIPGIPDPVVPLDSWWTWSCVGGVGLALLLITVLCLCLFVRFRRNLRTIQKLSLGSQSGAPNSHCHSGLGRMGTATFDFVGDFDHDFDTFVPKYGNKYQLEGRNPDLDEKNIGFIHQLLL